MRIMLVTAGSRGDVEPFVRLARRAQQAGHEVALMIPDNAGVDTTGVTTLSLGADYSALIADQGVSPIAAMRSFDRVVRPVMRAVIVNPVSAALEFGPDVLVTHPKILSAGLIAGQLGIPWVLVELVPVMTATAEFPAPGTVSGTLGPLNRLTYAAAGASARMFARELTEARTLLRDALTEVAPASTLIPVSPHLLRRPADWPDSVHLTGVWNEPTAPGALPAEVEALPSAGPVAYAGFGSMAAGDAERRGRIIVDAARKRGWGLVAATGLGGIRIPADARGADVVEVDSVDHAALLPRTVAAIHHGGIGTVQAAAVAGVTSVIVPFIADQPFWGAQLHRAGLAPKPIPQRRMTAARLGAALEAVDRYAARNRELAPQIAAEDGLREAIERIEAAAS
jgi:sterol 3beta-glucosyltransferase